MKTFPTLYKKTATGAIQQWTIAVDKNCIITTHGQVDGKLQTVEDVVKDGKNLGRSNETTPAQQATMEAEARHTRQRKKGYVDSIAAAQAGELDELIEGGVAPMLAKSFDDHGKKITFPCAVQPKLDGHRCVAIVKDGKCTLWTRSRKPITSVPHIAHQLEMVAARINAPEFIVDGELYNHNLKSDFERISSMVRQQQPHPDATRMIEYHVYDLIDMETPFADRAKQLRVLGTERSLCIVHTRIVETHDQLMSMYEEFLELGYEGAMARNLHSNYEAGKRSIHLQKIKTMKDEEFPIIRLEEGRGKLMGHAGSCVCSLPDGREFNVKMSGDTAALKAAWENPKLWVGKQLTVQFQGYTTAGMPRFPVGLRIREAE